MRFYKAYLKEGDEEFSQPSQERINQTRDNLQQARNFAELDQQQQFETIIKECNLADNLELSNYFSRVPVNDPTNKKIIRQRRVVINTNRVKRDPYLTYLFSVVQTLVNIRKTANFANDPFYKFMTQFNLKDKQDLFKERPKSLRNFNLLNKNFKKFITPYINTIFNNSSLYLYNDDENFNYSVNVLVKVANPKENIKYFGEDSGVTLDNFKDDAGNFLPGGIGKQQSNGPTIFKTAEALSVEIDVDEETRAKFSKIDSVCKAFLKLVQETESTKDLYSKFEKLIKDLRNYALSDDEALKAQKLFKDTLHELIKQGVLTQDKGEDWFQNVFGSIINTCMLKNDK